MRWIPSLLLIPFSVPLPKNLQLYISWNQIILSPTPQYCFIYRSSTRLFSLVSQRLSLLAHCLPLQTTPFLIFGDFNIHVDNLFKSLASQFPEPLSSSDTVFHIILAICSHRFCHYNFSLSISIISHILLLDNHLLLFFSLYLACKLQQSFGPTRTPDHWSYQLPLYLIFLLFLSLL